MSEAKVSPLRAWLPVGVALILLLLACSAGIADMVRRWLEDGSYYGHGPMVPFVCGWMVWRQRAQLLALERGSDAAGLLFLAAALPLYGIGLLEDIAVFINGALLLSLIGLALLFLGRAVVRELWVMFVFLGFMVPLPTVVIEGTTFQLKLLAARLSVAAIKLSGTPAILDGGTIHLTTTSVLVDDVCSGLKTLITLSAISVLFAYLQPSRLKAAMVLALGIPIAILANVVRILILCYLTVIGSEAAQEGPLHEGTGLLVYAIAVLLLLGVQALPDPGGQPAEDAPPPEPREGLFLPARPPRRLAVPALTGLGLAALLSLSLQGWQWTRPPPSTELVTRRVPAQIGDWQSVEVPLGEDVYRVLGTRDAVMRRYSRDDRPGTVDLYITRSTGDIFRVAHPPEQCFTGGGYTELERQVVELDTGARRVPANRLLFQKGTRQLVLVYYWYRLNQDDVASYVDYRFTSFMGRFRRYESSGCMIRLSALVDAEGVEAADRRVAEFTQEALEAALQPIS